jgi:hypothetical protein
MEQTPTKQRKLVSAVTLAPELQKQVLAIARARDWSIAQTGGYLIKLGLEKLSEEKPGANNATSPQEAALV